MSYNDPNREAFEAWVVQLFGYSVVLTNTQYEPKVQVLLAAWQASRRVALEDAAKRSDAYTYMSQNFTALAEEIRRMK